MDEAKLPLLRGACDGVGGACCRRLLRVCGDVERLGGGCASATVAVECSSSSVETRVKSVVVVVESIDDDVLWW